MVTCAVLITAVFWAFFADRPEYFDDIALFSAAYTYLHQGVVSYPVQGQFQSMTIQPPLHYWILGSLMRIGFPAYYAEAIPPFFFLLLAVFVTVKSRFSLPVKLGVFFGLSVPFLIASFEPHVRPDIHRGLALFAGLLLLEDGRNRGWSVPHLFFGSVVVTYASTLHYPGFLAWTGVLVYAAWVVVRVGWKNAAKPFFALIVGGCAVGLPYLLFYVLPQWHEIINSVRSVAPLGGIGASLRVHRELYQNIYHFSALGLPGRVLFYPIHVGIPLIVLSTVFLLGMRETRGMALAGLPYPLFLLTVITHKLHWPMYLLPEFMMYVTGLVALVGWAVCRHVGSSFWRRLAGATGFAVLLALILTCSVAKSIRVSTRPQVHEKDIARAAGRAILGPNALVGAAHGIMWYPSGATHYYDVGSDLLQPLGVRDVKSYFHSFDAVALNQIFSDVTYNSERKSLASWYADGTLKLKGFYLSDNDTLPYLLLTPDRQGTVTGFAKLRNNRIARFEQRIKGDYVYAAAVCDRPAPFSTTLEFLRPRVFALPLTTSTPQEINVLLMREKEYSKVRSSIANRCSILDEVTLDLVPVDQYQLLATLKNDDVIRFYENFEEVTEMRWGPEAQVKVAEDGWPLAVSFTRGLHKGESYSLSGGTRPLFQSDLDSPQELQVVKYERGGQFQVLGDGLVAGDRSGKFIPGTSNDHIVSEFRTPSVSKTGLLFFTVWIKTADGQPVPISIQDENYTVLAHARLALKRGDGWMFMLGWTHVPTGHHVRIAIEPRGREVLIDKVLLEQVPDNARARSTSSSRLDDAMLRHQPKSN